MGRSVGGHGFIICSITLGMAQAGVSRDSFKTLDRLTVGARSFAYHSLPRLATAGHPGVARYPFSIKVLIENALRLEDDRLVEKSHLESLLAWDKPGTQG